MGPSACPRLPLFDVSCHAEVWHTSFFNLVDDPPDGAGLETNLAAVVLQDGMALGGALISFLGDLAHLAKISSVR